MDRKRVVLAFITLLIAICMAAPTIFGHCLANLGMISFWNALSLKGESINSEFEPHPFLSELSESTSGLPIALLNQAARFDPGSSTIRWASGRVALATGDTATAIERFKSISDGPNNNPLLYQDFLAALISSYGWDPEQIVTTYEAASKPMQPEPVNDTLALAYLDARGAKASEEVKHLRPSDLFANYHLWKEAIQSNNPTQAKVYEETLTYFPLEAITPTDDRLLGYVAEVIPHLLDEKIWDQDQALNTVAFMVWQQCESESTEHLLKHLIEIYPAQPDWQFYLAELYHRQGELEKAVQLYQQVLDSNSEYSQTYLRLGMINQLRATQSGQSQWLEKATKWYERYREASPSDLLALKDLAEIYEVLRQENSVLLREELVKINDRQVVAQLLGVPAEDITLGPNLVINGGFEKWDEDRPEWWEIWDMAEGDSRNKGLFVGGKDGLTSWGGDAARLHGLWLREQASKAPGRSGFLHIDEQSAPQIIDEHQTYRRSRSISLSSRTIYVLSFYYRTDFEAEANWVSPYNQSLFSERYILPATHGNWQRFVAIGSTPSMAGPSVSLLLRLFSPGSVWFDEIELRSIRSQTPVQLDDTRFAVVDGN